MGPSFEGLDLWDLVFSPNGKFWNLDTALHKPLYIMPVQKKWNDLTASIVPVVMFSTTDIATLSSPESIANWW
jgi:hypothetical protein